ncbi:class I SAM-dependent methyltransferase [Luteipulveratus halotolerans]|uniref:class I SAM-dependent methyltransferase n=1 Tax=Luteipulveratus halotolerans TaxID=1631356 RepID=UPI000681C88D|nr:class I SAM-dependent methyltransferase [Luteipulveratus halotolerans]
MTHSRTIGHDRATVRRQYSSEEPLEARRSIWRGTVDGTAPHDLALARVVEVAPADVLEIGCGTGEFAVRVAAALPDATVTATDQSERMVDLSRERGVSAEVVDATDLPYADASFDVVCAMWMLYHVPDLERTIAEVRRVLRPGGRFIAATNSERHTADLRALAGIGPARTQFSSENGEAALRAHFEHVVAHHHTARAVADHAAATAYIASFAPDAARTIEPYDGERTFTGAGTVFVAS